ncbi:MAG: hypothetical protein M1839_003527 [Geoglossum umbratile]|nr:MAG: hypothetical protein M1839_003527 [Geoglossum umbratile]
MPEGFEWTMTHAFFADMGGFILETSDEVPFPLDAKQVHYLVTKGYLDPSMVCVEKEHIDDKNKSDTPVRVITSFQIAWFTLSCIGRKVQHLAITTLELTTLGFILCTFATSFYWIHKPSDVNTAITVTTRTRPSNASDAEGANGTRITLACILQEAEDARSREPYFNSPLDFVSRREWWWTKFWSYALNIVRITLGFSGKKARPWQRIPNDNFPKLSSRATAILFFFNLGFPGFTIAAWDFHFPSHVERLLWRISSVGLPGCLVAFFCWQNFVWQILPALEKHYPWWFAAKRHVPETERAPGWCGAKQLWYKTVAKMRNIGAEKDPNLDMPAKAVIPLFTISAFYCIFRYYTLLEDFLALRALPSSAYATVEWAQMIPHW